MKERNFLKKIGRAESLEIVEKSEQMKDSYLAKSISNIESAKILLEKNKLEESVSLAYFSMYNSLLALLFKNGIKCENHSGAIILLKEVFDLDNSQIKLAKKERIDKQYYADFHVVKKDTEELIEIAEEFNSIIFDFIEKMKETDIEKARKILREILK